MGDASSKPKSRSSSSSGSHFFDFAKDGVRVTGQMLIGALIALTIAMFSAGVIWTRIETRVSDLEKVQAENTAQIERMQEQLTKLVARVDMLIRVNRYVAGPVERRRIDYEAERLGVNIEGGDSGRTQASAD